MDRVGPIHAFLRGDGRDGRGRTIDAVLGFDDAAIEQVHDFIQWLFPLAEASRAVAGAPVLTAAEAAAIRADPLALDGLRRGTARMQAFYAATDSWLTGFDHNHLRITRILTALSSLLGPEAAAAFHQTVVQRNQDAGAPINPTSLQFWSRAAG